MRKEFKMSLIYFPGTGWYFYNHILQASQSFASKKLAEKALENNQLKFETMK